MVVWYCQGKTLKGLAYSLPVPAVSSEISGSSIHIKQKRLNKNQQVSLSISSLVGGMPTLRDEKVETYHRAKIQIGSSRFETPSQLFDPRFRLWHLDQWEQHGVGPVHRASTCGYNKALTCYNG